MPYPYVRVSNSTDYPCSGEVKYSLCSTDKYKVGAGKTWMANSRGLCLLTVVSATVHTPEGDVRAEPYTSSGTSYSQFVVVKIDGRYLVSRVVNTPEAEVEPLVAEEMA